MSTSKSKAGHITSLASCVIRKAILFRESRRILIPCSWWKSDWFEMPTFLFDKTNLYTWTSVVGVWLTSTANILPWVSFPRQRMVIEHGIIRCCSITGFPERTVDCCTFSFVLWDGSTWSVQVVHVYWTYDYEVSTASFIQCISDKFASVRSCTSSFNYAWFCEFFSHLCSS